MPASDFLFVIRWWAVICISGLFFLPLSGKLFPSFADRGYAFSKILSVIIVSYIVFTFSIFRIIPFSSVSITGIFALSALGIFILFRKQLSANFPKKVLALLLIEEILFFLCLLAWSYVRGFNPEIYGLEKYMDFGFVNSILRSEFLPPMDMWYSPKPINYYYFGHFITALLTKASGIPSFVTYNLMIATLFALSFIESFSLGITLLSQLRHNFKKPFVKIFFGGILIAGLVTLSGNLHIIYSFFKPYAIEKPVPFWDLEFSLPNPCYGKQSYTKKSTDGKTETIQCPELEQQKALSYPNAYWYPNATRFIHNTIHEFPIYSWVVADLHGHVADVPAVIFTIAFLYATLYQVMQTHEQQRQTHRKVRFVHHLKMVFADSKSAYWNFLFIGFLIAVMYMTNAWDGLTYLLLTVVLLSYLQWRRIRESIQSNTTNNPIVQILPIKNIGPDFARYIKKYWLLDVLIGVFVYLFIIFIPFFIFSRPFSLHFDASKIVGGIGVVGAPSFFLERNQVNGNSYGSDNRNILQKIFIPDHCKSLMSAQETSLVTTQYSERKIGPFLFEPDHCLRSPWWQLLILYGFFYFFAGALTIFLLKKKHRNTADIFLLLLIITASILILLPEFFYMKDIYPDHYRANTMFKLVFQAFIMLSFVSGYAVLRTISGSVFLSLRRRMKIVYVPYPLVSVLFITLVFTYPYFAIQSYYSQLITYQGLDGLRYLKNRNPDDYEAVKWLNDNVDRQVTVLEAQGDSYTDYERISANTGLPTVLGWYVHEWLWRGVDAPKERSDEVRRMYESTDTKETAALLKKYSVAFVVVGPLERQKYPLLRETMFSKFGNKVFESGATKIYRIAEK